VQVWQTSNLRQLRLGEEKKKRKKEEETTGQKYNGLPYRFAKRKGREPLYLTFMMGFFYGSYRKKEENFEFLQRTAMLALQALY